ncbi:MAG: DUF1036 domain-containing protein [Alphaproteobacteria bacterium]|nr:DUF1036 domain-containing protein [Alphaproteobacteria bacterium]MBV9694100.1 DUF1036 domain-containing protein [Alphaproteobacteria bacterium]
MRILPAIVAAALCLLATGAEAQLKLCNRTSYVLYAATGHAEGIDAVTQGWTRVVPGTCQTALHERLKAKGYFVYARTSLAHQGAMRNWGGTQKLCVKDADFTLTVPFAAMRCPADDTFDRPFAGVETRGARSWAMTFDDQPSFATLKDAEAAGLKRLLRDTGAKIGAIDPKPDKSADAALAAFRKRLNMKADATPQDLFDALETEALKTSAPQGYAICDDADKPVWVALGENDKGRWRSRGWWKIAAGGCAKAIAEPLAADKIYILVQTPGGIPIATGKAKFCTTNIEFDIQGRENCAKRGLNESGFAETDVKGLAGYTAHVGEQGLLLPKKR